MKLFVSYCHKDKKWLDRLCVQLAPLIQEGLDLWDDRRITPGALWKDEILHALEVSEGAILLITADFLASSFISNEELPTILRDAKANGTKVLSLIVGPCLFSQSQLSEFQTLNDPSKPISGLRKASQDKELRDIAEKIMKIKETSSATSQNSSKFKSQIPSKDNSGSVSTRIAPTAPIVVALNNDLVATMIRVSISGLFRIQHNQKFLLVRGHRIGNFQPVGGVLKRWPSSAHILDVLGVKEDNKIAKDEDSVDDLRIQVPGRSLIDFFDWYRTKKNRETYPWREFHEELIATGILPDSVFPHIATEHLWTYVSGIKWSVHFQCWEILVSEIFETLPNNDQMAVFTTLQDVGHIDIRWATEAEIHSRGVIPQTRLVADIADNATWLL